MAAAAAAAASTQLGMYVATQVEVQPGLLPEEYENDAAFSQLLASLFSRGVKPPVSFAALHASLQDVDRSAVQVWMRREPTFYARALKTLNGPHFKLVPDDVLRCALEMEARLSEIPVAAAWGLPDPPVHATSYRLLTSAGLPEQLLPAYTTLTIKFRSKLMEAWAATCSKHGWKVTNPACDVHAERRVISRRLKREGGALTAGSSSDL